MIPKNVSRFESEDDYQSYVGLPPDNDVTTKYLKEEIEKAASLYQQKKLTIGVGIAHLYDFGLSLAREASKRRELSDKLSNRELEIELRDYAKRFPNVIFVSINSKPTHRAMMTVWVLGNYSEN